jgi:hypothetical protein
MSERLGRRLDRLESQYRTPSGWPPHFFASVIFASDDVDQGRLPSPSYARWYWRHSVCTTATLIAETIATVAQLQQAQPGSRECEYAQQALTARLRIPGIGVIAHLVNGGLPDDVERRLSDFAREAAAALAEGDDDWPWA